MMSKNRKNKKSTKSPDRSGAIAAQSISIIEKIKSALKFKQVGDLRKAAGICNEILVVEPNNVDANYLLGIIAIHVGNNNGAVQFCKKAIEGNANQEDIHNTLGCALFSLGQIDAAVASYKKALSINPDYVDAYNNLGNALKELGDIEQAIVSFKKALSIRPSSAEGYCNLGNALKELGKFDEAIDSYKKALSIKPDYAEAYMCLSRAVKNIGCEAIEVMKKLYVNKNISDEDRMFLGFALGNSLENIKEYEESFDFYMEGNRLKRESFSYSSRRDHDVFKEIKEVFSADFFSRNKESGDKSEIPIFIVGMPRSGTSLVEQILASHPYVYGAGELYYLTHIVQNKFSDVAMGVFPGCIPKLDSSDFKKYGSYYMDKIRKHSESSKYVTDKMPQNFLFVGLIKAILPSAKIIHCMRDPMDNCLSIFKNNFSASGSHEYAYELGELGRYYNLYLDLMRHWRDVLPGFIYDIQYEELIKDQENQTRQLLDFCDLPWDDACLEFYKTKRRVKTASNVQVRNPIYNDSVQLWKRYERQLEPLSQAIYGD